MWYQLAANQEHAFSQRILGTLYKYGLGVEQDHMQAIEWYLMAAKLGDSYARHYLNLTDSGANDPAPATHASASILWRDNVETSSNPNDGNFSWQYNWSHLPIYRVGYEYGK